MLSNYEVKWQLLFPFFPKYRAKVFLIVFDSLHLRSDGDWNPCPQVLLVKHLYGKRASRTKRRINHFPPFVEKWGEEGQRGKRRLEEGRYQKLLDPTCRSLKTLGKGMQERATKTETGKESFVTFVVWINLCRVCGEREPMISAPSRFVKRKRRSKKSKRQKENQRSYF